MPITNKSLGVNLTSTPTTTLLTAGATETIRITHIIVSSSTTAGSITLSLFDSSAATAFEMFNARSISANSNLELFDLFLEPNDQLRGGFTTATGSKITIFYQVETP